jgi:hypothetical protein
MKSKILDCIHKYREMTNSYAYREELFKELVGDLDLGEFKNGYFADPGSAVFHDNFYGGLFYHSLRCLYVALNICNIYGFDEEYVLKNAKYFLLHDLCKVGWYEEYDRNVKDKFGNWSKVKEYRIIKGVYGFSHGYESLRRMFNLGIEVPEEFQMAVIHHMGADEKYGNVSDYYNAANKYPQVLLMQNADHMSCCDWYKI